MFLNYLIHINNKIYSYICYSHNVNYIIDLFIIETTAQTFASPVKDLINHRVLHFYPGEGNKGL